MIAWLADWAGAGSGGGIGGDEAMLCIYKFSYIA